MSLDPPAPGERLDVARSHPILCALEDTAASKHAFRASTWLARSLETPLVAVHVFDPMGIRTHSKQEMLGAGMGDREIESVARLKAELLLDEIVREPSAARLTTELAEGRPVPELLRLATEKPAALLVTGTARRAGIDRLLIGSVAGELAARAPCPVIVVPQGALLAEPGPVVAGYDGSVHSLRAARHAAALAARLGRGVVLVHVTDSDDRVDFDFGPELPDELAKAARALGGRPDRPALDLKVSLVVEEGDPVKVLSHLARERSAALIVSGNRGRGQIGSALLGSVSCGLVGSAGCPVATVPASAGAAESGT